MPNIRLEIEYDGTNYCGWQVQSRAKKKSIQEVIEQALQEILRKKIKVIASGRTDAGVHARAQTANFKADCSIPPERLQLALNSILPPDIAISKVEEVSPDFHSRFSAKSKLYRYTILNRGHPSALSRDFIHSVWEPLDLKRMRQEAKSLLGKHDFSAFCASAGKKKNPVKEIRSLKITKKGDFIYIDIEANSFLYNMVRNIAGTLIEAGRGKLKKGALAKILASKDRKQAGATAPAKGLCLLGAKY